MTKTAYPTLSPMEAGYLVLVVDRHNAGELTGGTWGRKNVRAALRRFGLVDYGEKTQIVRKEGRGSYEGHPLVPTELGIKWVEWFHKACMEPRNWAGKRRRVVVDDQESRSDG